jgi:hypothetical protein
MMAAPKSTGLKLRGTIRRSAFRCNAAVLSARRGDAPGKDEKR